jgi:ABC-type antimicrobial peptide transport system permease subunit
MGGVETAIVNQSFVKLFFHGENPVGRKMNDAGAGVDNLEVIGVVRDQKLFAGIPVIRLGTMEEALDLNLSTEKQMMRLAGLFGLLATLLAAIGLYGVIAYTVARRTREIGLRMALGAGRANVARMFLREVAIVIAAGVAIGRSHRVRHGPFRPRAIV